LRGETDLRHYSDLFQVGCDEVTGPRKLLVRICARRENEGGNCEPPANNARLILREFYGERDRFLRLNGWHEFLGKEVRAITRPRWIEAVDQTKDVSVGIHVRMGDFVEPGSDPNNPHQRVPCSWYVQSLRAIRKVAGYPIRAILVSDGKEKELSELLAEENLSLVRTGSAISDLLLLSKSKLLIASAGSSFSAWAAFLGQMPSIAHPSKAFDWFHLLNQEGNYVGGFDPADPPIAFLDQVETVFSRTRVKQLF